MKWTFAGVVFKCRSVGGADSVHKRFSLDSMPQTAVVWFLFPLSRLAFFTVCSVLFLKQKLSVMFFFLNEANISYGFCSNKSSFFNLQTQCLCHLGLIYESFRKVSYLGAVSISNHLSACHLGLVVGLFVIVVDCYCDSF